MEEWAEVEDLLEIKDGPYDCDISAMDVDEKSKITELNFVSETANEQSPVVYSSENKFQVKNPEKDRN